MLTEVDLYEREFAGLKINPFFRKKNVCSCYSKQFVGLQPVIAGGKLAGNRKH